MQTEAHPVSEMLATAMEAARQAGQTIASHCLADHEITFKGYRDIVTEADIAAEEIVLGMIRDRFPDHAILSEEAGGTNGNEAHNGYTWVVDPLDGTTNYAHRIPLFSVSIGVVDAVGPLLGVVYDPLRDQMFVARRGKGTRVNDRPMHVSPVTRLAHAVVGLDWARDDAVRQAILIRLLQLAPRVGTIRALGSAALGLAYVAAGWLDAYFHPALGPWDAAAGTLLVQESGGRCTTLNGAPYHIHLTDCLATNGSLHRAVLALIETHDSDPAMDDPHLDRSDRTASVPLLAPD